MTAPLCSRQLLEIRELTTGLHPVDQALTILRSAEPEAGVDPASLPIAERDRQLLELRRATFGERIACLVNCPNCDETLEFDLSATQLLVGIKPVAGREVISAGAWEIELRPLDSRDIAAAALTNNPAQAAALLVRRAIHIRRLSGILSNTPDMGDDTELPDDLRYLLEASVSEREAAGDIAIDLNCDACGHGWTVGFDIGGHFEAEIDWAARQLIREIVALGHVFGWSEADILAMSPARRRTYLEMAGLL